MGILQGTVKTIRIISRNSQLALQQADIVKGLIGQQYPDLLLEVIGVTTRGDKILDRSLDKVGGKGLFIKELENSLLEQTADIAVHSLKDLPAKLNAQFTLAAILKREDAADAFISNQYVSLDTMPDNAVIGTASARRIAILKQYYPHLQAKLLRGNLQTRLNKLDNGEYDAIILAVSGLKRLNLETRIRQILDINQFLPAIGQGALAIEVLSSRPDLFNLLSNFADADTTLAVNTERFLGERLGASCSVPIAAYAEIDGDNLQLDVRLWDMDNNHICQAQIKIDKTKYNEAVEYCVTELLNQGAEQILAKYK